MTGTAMPEVRESEAEGKVKAVFEDVKTTLGSPTVGLLFRRLAVYPWYLQLAWRNLKPNVTIHYFNVSADSIRRAAADAVETRVGPLAGPAPGAAFQNAVQLFRELDPKLLMVTGLLRAGTNGQVPTMNMITAAEKRIVPSRRFAFDSELIEVSGETGATGQALIDEIYIDSGISPGQLDLSVLAASTDTLSNVWQAVKPAVTGPEAERAALHLRAMAANATEAMPFRMEISATASRQSGLSEDQIDSVTQIVADAWSSLARLTLAASAMHVAAGAVKPSQHLASTVAAGSE